MQWQEKKMKEQDSYSIAYWKLRNLLEKICHYL